MDCRKNGGALAETIRAATLKVMNIHFFLGYKCAKECLFIDEVNSKIIGSSIKSGHIRIEIKNKIKEYDSKN
jgi:hypothetical protein